MAVALWEVKSSSNDVKFPANVHANTKPYAKSGFHFVLLYSSGHAVMPPGFDLLKFIRKTW